jgi:hypothetical protein
VAIDAYRSRATLALFVFVLACVAGAARAGSATRAVRDRDWKNGDYDLGDGHFVFVEGRHTELTEDRTCSVCLWIREITFGDIDGDGAEEAILLIDSNLRGAGTSLDAYVFGVVDGKPAFRARIEGGDRGDGGLQSVSVAAGEVLVRRFELTPSDDVCCPSRVLVERWRWRDGKLLKVPGAPRVQKRKPRRWSERP